MPDVEYSRDQLFYRLPDSLCQLLYEAGEIATDKAKEAVGGLKDQAGDKLKGLFGN